MIAVSNEMYANVNLVFRSKFCFKSVVYFIYNREIWEFFWGVKMVGVLVFTWFVGDLEVEREQSKIQVI